MAKKQVPQAVTEAIIKVFPVAANMEIAVHPLGNGYCVYDDHGNVAGFEYDSASHIATMLYDNISPKEPKAELSATFDSTALPGNSTLASSRLYPRVADISWRHCPNDGHGALPGFLNFVGILALLAGLFFLLPLIYPGVALFVVAMFFFWFAEVLTSLRHIEAHLYSANHPDWLAKPVSRRKD